MGKKTKKKVKKNKKNKKPIDSRLQEMKDQDSWNLDDLLKEISQTESNVGSSKKIDMTEEDVDIGKNIDIKEDDVEMGKNGDMKEDNPNSPSSSEEHYNTLDFQNILYQTAKSFGVEDDPIYTGVAEHIKMYEVELKNRRLWVKDMISDPVDVVKQISETQVLLQELKSFLHSEILLYSNFLNYKTELPNDKHNFFENKTKNISQVKQVYEVLKQLMEEHKGIAEKNKLLNNEIQEKTKQAKIMLKEKKQETVKILDKLLQHENDGPEKDLLKEASKSESKCQTSMNPLEPEPFITFSSSASDASDKH